MIKIAPSLLSADFSRLEEQIRILENCGADMLHVDVMDGHFVPNITIGPAVISSVRNCTKLPFDVHLMIQHPNRLIKSFADAGSDIITVHAEAEHDMDKTIKLVREN
ncbi:MAG: ribulose-phosphate 3-epimerase, partial [Thermoplasmatales archaeon]|nr:ribulose-phosphate 3-epimerase [Thermoplasmatales archaeon]